MPLAQKVEIEFACQNCGQCVSADSKYAGKVFNCPGCNATLTVPIPSRITEKAMPERRRVRWMAILVIGLVTLGCAWFKIQKSRPFTLWESSPAPGESAQNEESKALTQNLLPPEGKPETSQSGPIREESTKATAVKTEKETFAAHVSEKRPSTTFSRREALALPMGGDVPSMGENGLLSISLKESSCGYTIRDAVGTFAILRRYTSIAVDEVHLWISLEKDECEQFQYVAAKYFEWSKIYRDKFAVSPNDATSLEKSILTFPVKREKSHDYTFIARNGQTFLRLSRMNTNDVDWQFYWSLGYKDEADVIAKNRSLLVKKEITYDFTEPEITAINALTSRFLEDYPKNQGNEEQKRILMQEAAAKREKAFSAKETESKKKRDALLETLKP